MTQSLLFVQPQAVVTRQRSMPASSIFRKAHNGEMTLSRATSQQPHCHLPQNRSKAKKNKKNQLVLFFLLAENFTNHFKHSNIKASKLPENL